MARRVSMALAALLAATTTLATLTQVARATHASVSLASNGYEGTVVAISPSVDEIYANDVIDSIKKTIGEASEVLFKATRQRAFFRDVKILLPKTWTKTSYDHAAITENFQDSDIRIDKSNAVYGNQPYTDQPGGCGDPGRYIHLTPDYLTDDTEADKWGPREKSFVHEWARFRWGVFDELGYPDDPKYPLFYMDFSNFPFASKPNYCANEELTGNKVDNTTGDLCSELNGLPTATCRFDPDSNQVANSSLMSYYYLSSIEEFCDSTTRTPHVADAPNRHNDKCSRSSVWDVIEAHADFVGGANPPASNSIPTRFTVLRQEEAKFALVLDYSGSMGSYDRIVKLQRAARRWILHEVSMGSSVAIIKFTSTATLVSGLTPINSDATRQSLAQRIDIGAGGGTCIGCGLQMAIGSVLNGHNNAVILLITDGQENPSPPTMSDVMSDVVASGARVVTIAFGESADPRLELLAKNTNGKTFTVKDTDNGNQLNDAFLGALTYQPGEVLAETFIKIYETNYQGPNRVVTEQFTVDASLGRDLTFELETNTPSHVVTRPHLIRPDGTMIDTATFDSTSNMYTITVAIADVGQWSYSVGLSGSSSNFISVTVAAKARTPSTDPIHTKAWASAGSGSVNAATNPVIIYAEVKQGNSPVVGARVKALISETSSTSAAEELELYDNGNAGDSQAGDGIYSRYLTKYSSTGRYSVKAQVWNDGSALINNGFTTSRRKKRSHPAARNRRSVSAHPLDKTPYCCGSVVPLDLATATPTGNFTRVAPGGSFQVTTIPPASADTFGPARVTDLRMAIENGNLTLTWTATGDDIDSGVVSGYDIRLAHNTTYLHETTFDNSANNTTLLLTVADSGNLTHLLVEAGQEVTLNLTLKEEVKYDTPYLVALRAVDEAGNRSPVSNVASAIIQTPPPPADRKGLSLTLIVIG
ncbi:calcium-activated chloride channel regulator 1-like [Penaeus japonicus]|uniref:calcium-activated chloride channel regulator 1-like n=1 Tax=Penaeus japonicus TaxID=27405 RepID=UPI001C70D20C|nr:calcium-activated chloride channel regulator 1-like [Penaeus japonicus]XP_042884904.1 calcium-activated chloride channel regulator 1-like [Penaeus japonicus]